MLLGHFLGPIGNFLFCFWGYTQGCSVHIPGSALMEGSGDPMWYWRLSQIGHVKDNHILYYSSAPLWQQIKLNISDFTL